jgi:hypothetical protein
MKHMAPQELLYSRFYWYRSGVTDTMKLALRNITHSIENLMPLKEGDVVLDIGSNDGTLLRTYAMPGLVTVGVEPADNLADEGRQGLTHHIHDFWDYETYMARVGRRARIVTAIGMFYDLEDPNKFIGDIAKALDDDGLFVAQLMCLRDMLELADVGNLAHEHLEYYSLQSLRRIFGRYGMEIFDLERNRINGGSYRLFVRHIGAPITPRVGAADRLREADEAERGLDDPQVFTAFFERLERNKEETVRFIKDAVAAGKRVWVYGASTKGNVILQYYGLDATLIEGASDRSPEKWGKYTIGTGIPIYSEAHARAAKPDYFLVLPYAFLDEFIRRESDWRDAGGRFIVPLPQFRVV